jgi:hypothetical protein
MPSAPARARQSRSRARGRLAEGEAVHLPRGPDERARAGRCATSAGRVARPDIPPRRGGSGTATSTRPELVDGRAELVAMRQPLGAGAAARPVIALVNLERPKRARLARRRGPPPPYERDSGPVLHEGSLQLSPRPAQEQQPRVVPGQQAPLRAARPGARARVRQRLRPATRRDQPPLPRRPETRRRLALPYLP